MRRSMRKTRPSTFYRRALQLLNQSEIPYLVGGAYAVAFYTGIVRDTKDVDVFVRPRDCRRVLDWFTAAGYHSALTFPHWLGKVFHGENLLDVIFSSGNGVATVDEGWFDHAISAELLGQQVRFCPVEETIWSKSYIQERERFDGADIHHLLRARGAQLNWQRLLDRFDEHWRVLLGHLVVFGFVYPKDRAQIPDWVMQELLKRMKEDRDNDAKAAICQGTLLSRSQYLIDVDEWGYQDGRRKPNRYMTPDDIQHWTAAIDSGK